MWKMTKISVLFLIGIFLGAFLLPLMTSGGVQATYISRTEIKDLRISADGKYVIGGWIVLTIVLDQGEEHALITTKGSIPIEQRDYPNLAKDAILRISDYTIDFTRGTPFIVGKVYKGAIIQKTSPPDGYGKLRYYRFIAIAKPNWEAIYVPYKVKITQNENGVPVRTWEKIVISGYHSTVSLIDGMELRDIGEIPKGFISPTANRSIIAVEKEGSLKTITSDVSSVETRRNYLSDAWSTKGIKWGFTSPFRLHVTYGDKNNEEFDGLKIVDNVGNVLVAKGKYANESHPIEGVDNPCNYSSEISFSGVGRSIYLCDLSGWREWDDTGDEKSPLLIHANPDLKVGFYGTWYGGDEHRPPNWEIWTKTEVLTGNKYGWVPADEVYPLSASSSRPNSIYVAGGTFHAILSDFLYGDATGTIYNGGDYELKPLSEGNARKTAVFRRQTGLNDLTDMGDLDRFVWKERISEKLNPIAQEGWDELVKLTGYKLFEEKDFAPLGVDEMSETAGTEWAGYSTGSVGYVDSGTVILYTLGTIKDIKTGWNPMITLWLDASKFSDIVYAGGLGEPKVEDNMDITLYGGRPYGNIGQIKVKNVGIGGDTFITSFKLTSVPSGVAISCSPTSLDLSAGEEGVIPLYFNVSEVPPELDGSRWEGEVTVTAFGTGKKAVAKVGGILRHWVYTPTYTAEVTVRVRLIKEEGVFYADTYQVTIAGQTVIGMGSGGAKFTLTLEKEAQTFDIHVKVLNPSGLPDRTESRTIVKGVQTIDIDYDLRVKKPPVPSWLLTAVIGGVTTTVGVGGTYYATTKRKKAG